MRIVAAQSARLLAYSGGLYGASTGFSKQALGAGAALAASALRVATRDFDDL